MIVCTMPGCQTTVGCQCRGYREVDHRWPDETRPPVSTVGDAFAKGFAAGRLAGLREAAEVLKGDVAGGVNAVRVKTGGRVVSDGGEEWFVSEREFNQALRNYAAAILALASGNGTP